MKTISEDILKKYFLGNSLAAKILYEEFDNTVESLQSDAPLGVLTGPLTGAPVPYACKTSFRAKSPPDGDME